MPRVIVIDPNQSERFIFVELATPEPRSNEALVRVSAFSLNLGEIRKAFTGAERVYPGWDLVGTVMRAADDGSGPAEGLMVVGMLNSGSWAEQVAVPTHSLAVVPERVTIAQAATLPVAGMTALHAVERASGLLGRMALVTGASGGVGLFACQLARLSGARVVGLIRQAAYQSIVEAAGVEQVIVSESAAAAGSFGPYRLVVEAVGGPVLAQTLTMIAADGVCVSLAASAGAEVTLNLWSLARAGRASLYGLVIFNEFQRETASTSLGRLLHLVAAGQLRPHIAVEADWSKIRQIASLFWQRRIPGKVVLHIKQ
jgi:NADPH:quinone reductase-like Zn-dependent oxidoreductase